MKNFQYVLYFCVCIIFYPVYFLKADVEVDWVARGGAYGLDKCNAVCRDSNGYVYVTGQYSPQASFIGGDGIYVNPTDEKIFIAKLHPDTGRLIWVKDAGGVMSNIGYDICMDPNGDILVTGVCSGNVVFGDAFFVESTGSYDIFVAKLSSDGDWEWVKVIGNSNSKGSRSITSDANGDIYIAGYYYDELVVGSDTLSSRGDSDGFIAKISGEGQWQWGRSFGGTSQDKCFAVVSDSSGNVYGTGYYAGQATVGSLGNITAVSSYDSFVFKINSSGQWQWVRSFGGTSLDYAYDIDLNTQNEPCVVGYFGGNSTFGDLPEIESSGQYDLFVASLNSSGVWQWVKSAGTVDSTIQVYGFDIDERNNCYLTGGFSNTLQLPGLDSMASNGYQDIFVAKLGADFNWKWSISMGNTGSESGIDLVADSKGCFAVGGYQKEDTYFGSKRLGNYGHVDYYAARLLTEVVSPTDYDADGSSDLFWQNPSNNLVSCWYLDGSGGRTGSVQLANGLANDKLISSGDVNGDGFSDLLFVQERDESNHYVEVWYNDGVEGISGRKAYRDIAKEWKFIKAGDLNRDGYLDLIWQNINSGRVVVWYLDAGGNMSGSATIVNWIEDWQLIDVCDLNGDSNLDLVWQRVNPGSYQVAAWYLDSDASRTGNEVIASIGDNSWRLVTIQDYNDDGEIDFLWQNGNTGKLVCWVLDSSLSRTDTMVLSGAIDPWRIASPAW